MIKIDYNEAPLIGKSYRDLIFSRKSGVPKDGALPDIELNLIKAKAEGSLLSSYNSLCQFEHSEYLPLTFPYVLAGPLHLALISHKDFPIKGAGLLHLRNAIKYLKPISKSDSFDLSIKTSQTRFRPQGFEFEIITEAKIDDVVYWTCTSTFLSRGKFSKEDPPSESETLFLKMEKKETDLSFNVPGNAGRAYAKLCRDYNPIHLATPLAWLFGFKKSIAHGMWVSARALGEMNLKSIKEFDLAFKGPVYTGSTVSILKQGEHFNLFCSGNSRPVITGRIIQ